MQRKAFSDMECPIARSVDQAGDGWTLLILRNAFLGARRFQDFETALGIPPNTLARRLDALVERGFLARRCYTVHPPRQEYELTPKGLDFLPVLLAFAAWGNRWLAPLGAPIECVDARTRVLVEPVLVDRRTRRELRAGKVALGAGPGASRALRRALRKPVLLGARAARGAGAA